MTDTAEQLRQAQNVRRADEWLFKAGLNIRAGTNPLDGKRLITQQQKDVLGNMLKDICDRNQDDPITAQTEFNEAAQPILDQSSRNTASANKRAILLALRQELADYRIAHPTSNLSATWAKGITKKKRCCGKKIW